MIFAVFDPSPLTVCINCSFFTFFKNKVEIHKECHVEKTSLSTQTVFACVGFSAASVCLSVCLSVFHRFWSVVAILDLRVGHTMDVNFFFYLCPLSF